MRHRKIGRKLNRNSSHRNSMFKNMVSSLIKYEFLRTTLPKAKELRIYFESIINIAIKKKKNSFNYLFSYIKDKSIIYKLINVIVPKFNDFIGGGYIQIFKCGFRKGDNAPMAYVKILKK